MKEFSLLFKKKRNTEEEQIKLKKQKQKKGEIGKKQKTTVLSTLFYCGYKGLCLPFFFPFQIRILTKFFSRQ